MKAKTRKYLYIWIVGYLLLSFNLIFNLFYQDMGLLQFLGLIGFMLLNFGSKIKVKE